MRGDLTGSQGEEVRAGRSRRFQSPKSGEERSRQQRTERWQVLPPYVCARSGVGTGLCAVGSRSPTGRDLDPRRRGDPFLIEGKDPHGHGATDLRRNSVRTRSGTLGRDNWNRDNGFNSGLHPSEPDARGRISGTGDGKQFAGGSGHFDSGWLTHQSS